MEETNGPARHDANLNSPLPQRRSVWPWIAGLAAIAVLTVGFWAADVPNRYRASQFTRAGRVALLRSDLPAALTEFRQAALARPTDETITHEYDQTQIRWLESVERKLTPLPPLDAYVSLQSLPKTDDVLVEPHASEFRQRSERITSAARVVVEEKVNDAKAKSDEGDFAAAYEILKSIEPYQVLVPTLNEKVREVQVAEVTHAIETAKKLGKNGHHTDALAALKEVESISAGVSGYSEQVQFHREEQVKAALLNANNAVAKSDFAEATKHLDEAAAVGVLGEQVTATRAEIRSKARQWSQFQIAAAIFEQNREHLAAALDAARKFGGWEHNATPEAFLGETKLSEFLKALTVFEIGGPSQATGVARFDLAVVMAARKQFKDSAEVDRFLCNGFTEWSRAMSKQKLHGVAVLLADYGTKFGMAKDETWRNEQIEAGKALLNLTIGTVVGKSHSETPAGFDAEANSTFNAALKKLLPTWPKVLDPGAKDGLVVLRGSFGGVITTDDPKTERRTARYQSGTEKVPNQERRQIVAEHNELIEDLNRLNRSIADDRDKVARSNGAPLGSTELSDGVGAAASLPFQESRARELRAQIAELKARGSAMPTLVDSPIYSDETYNYITHRYTYRGTWEVQPITAGSALDLSWTWDGSVKHQTDEVEGNASHNVPVKAPQHMPKPKILPAVTRQILAQLHRADKIMNDLPQVTLQAVIDDLEVQKASQAVVADRILITIHGWHQLDRALPDEEQILANIRHFFTLPE